MAESTALRLERARSALALAEEAVGVRAVSPAAFTASAPSRAKAHLAEGWPVPPGLAPLLPSGLRRGMAIAVHGPPATLLILASIPSQAGAYLACMGWDSLGWASAASLGICLERTVLVRSSRAADSALVSAAVDGCDVILLGPDIRLDSRERRLVARRALSRGALILAASAPGERAELYARYVGVEGMGKGSGHISAVLMDMKREYGAGVRLRIDAHGWNASTAFAVVAP